jgi:hypothetical protein
VVESHVPESIPDMNANAFRLDLLTESSCLLERMVHTEFRTHARATPNLDLDMHSQSVHLLAEDIGGRG